MVLGLTQVLTASNCNNRPPLAQSHPEVLLAQSPSQQLKQPRTKFASTTSTANFVIALTPTVVTQNVAYPFDKNTTSTPFIPTKLPTSNSNGAWTYAIEEILVCEIDDGCWEYASSNPFYVIVDRDSGRVTPSQTVDVIVTVTVTITATQAATTKHAGITSTANLVLDPPPPVSPVVSRALAYPMDKNTLSQPFSPISLPLSNSDGAWTYASSNPAMTSVDRNSGEVTGTGIAGTVTITATQAATKRYTTITTTATATFRAMRVGDTGPGGGKVFYDAGTTQSWGRYLEAAPTDYQVNGSRASVVWGCPETYTGATATAIGTGKANTTTILTKCTTAGIAARVAADYRGGGKSDWFLPSIDELNELCKIYSNGRTDTTQYAGNQNGCTGNMFPTGGFAADYYWSSSESFASTVAMGLQFRYGIYNILSRNYFMSVYYVRPVRAF